MSVLYATHGGSGASDTNLYTVDPATMATTAVGDTGEFFTGLAFDTDGTLYGVTGNMGTHPHALFSIDKATGAATLIGTLAATIADISFDSGGQLYGWRPSGNKLQTIDKATGALADVGASGTSGTSGNGFACDPSDSFFWLFPGGTHGDIFNVDKASGVATDKGVLYPYITLNATVSAAAIGPSDVLYGLGIGPPAAIFTVGAPVDVGGGLEYPCTLVGTFGDSQPWDGMTWDLSGDDGGGGDGGGSGPPRYAFSKIKFGNGLVVTDEGGGVIRVDLAPPAP